MANNQKTYNIDNMDSIMNSLNNLPKKDNILTGKEIVEKLLEQISKALAMRYSFKEISEIVFQAHGCQISAHTLKVNYEELTNTKKTRKKRVTKVSEQQ
jgi:hypothetical protein